MEHQDFKDARVGHGQKRRLGTSALDQSFTSNRRNFTEE